MSVPSSRFAPVWAPVGLWIHVHARQSRARADTMSEESVVSSRLRDPTESTEAEGRDDTHHPQLAIVRQFIARVTHHVSTTRTRDTWMLTPLCLATAHAPCMWYPPGAPRERGPHTDGEVAKAGRSSPTHRSRLVEGGSTFRVACPGRGATPAAGATARRHRTGRS